MLEESIMKIIDKIRDYFYGRQIEVKNITEVKNINDDYYRAAIYSKLPFMEKYCVWSSYDKSKNAAQERMMSAYNNKAFVQSEVSLVYYINSIWERSKIGWLNIIDIIDDDDDIIKKSKGVFKSPVKKWYWGLGVHKSVFHPFNDDYIHPILYINKWSLSWKPKYDYVCFEDNPQVWFCFFKFFWFGYKLVSPVKDSFENSYWEQMIWYVNYSDCDLKKAEETWYEEWNKEYLING